MQPSLEKLRKLFGLEREKGYENAAIIGGLAKMLDYWEGEARAESIKEEIIQAVVQRLRSYEGLSPVSRADALKGLWKRIAETYPEAGQRPASAPPRPAPAAPRPAPKASVETAKTEAPPPAAPSETAPTRPNPVLARP